MLIHTGNKMHVKHELNCTHKKDLSPTGTRSMIAVCYGYRIKLKRINIIRDMVMQPNFTYLPKTGQHSKHMVASQTSWL